MQYSKYLPRPLILAFALLMLAAAIFLAMLKDHRPQPSLIGGPFTLQSQSGKTVSEKDLLGHYSLLYFGYVQDKAYSSSALQVMELAVESFSHPPKSYFISVDPERDSPSALAAFLAKTAPSFEGLGGTPEQISQIAKAYHVYFQKRPNVNQPSVYEIDYSPLIYLMDPDGKFVKPFAYTTDAKGLAEELKKVLE